METKSLHQTETGGIPENGRIEYSGIKFEPALHGDSTEEKYEHLFLEASKGNVNVSNWPPHVASRMSEYQPMIVAVDGSLPIYESFEKKLPRLEYPKTLDTTTTKNLAHWIGLPGRPKRINSSGSVLTISGEPVDIFNHIPELDQLDESRRFPFNRAEHREIRKMESLPEHEKNDAIMWTTAVVGSALLMASAVPGASAVKEFKKVGGVTRREFLKGGLALFIGATGLTALSESKRASTRNDAPVKIARALTRQQVDYYQDAYKVANNSLITPGEINLLSRFRTAVLVEKIKDTIDTFGFPSSTPASLLMGNGHLYDNPDEMIHSDDIAEKTIVSYVEVLVSIVDRIMVVDGIRVYPDLDRNKVIEEMFNFIAKTEVLKFTDPGSDDIDPTFLSKINNLVSLEKSFVSKRVMNALQRGLKNYEEHRQKH